MSANQRRPLHKARISHLSTDDSGFESMVDVQYYVQGPLQRVPRVVRGIQKYSIFNAAGRYA